MGIFTQLNQNQFFEILSQFPEISSQMFSFEGVPEGSVNTYYRLTNLSTQERFYLKINEVDDQSAFENELSIFQFLQKHQSKLSFSIPELLTSKDQKSFIILEGKPIQIFRNIAGRSLELSDYREKHFKMIAERLFEIHSLEPDSRIQKHRFGLENIKKIYEGYESQATDENFKKTVTDWLGALSAIEPKKFKASLIHGDIFPDNLFWVQNKLNGIIDFDSAGLGHPLYDVAMCLHALCYDPQSGYNHSFIRAFFTGYQVAKPLSKQAFKLLNSYYLPLTALRLLITRYKDFELTKDDQKERIYRDYREILDRFDQLQALGPIDSDTLSL